MHAHPLAEDFTWVAQVPVQHCPADDTSIVVSPNQDWIILPMRQGGTRTVFRREGFDMVEVPPSVTMDGSVQERLQTDPCCCLDDYFISRDPTAVLTRATNIAFTAHNTLLITVAPHVLEFRVDIVDTRPLDSRRRLHLHLTCTVARYWRGHGTPRTMGPSPPQDATYLAVSCTVRGIRSVYVVSAVDSTGACPAVLICWRSVWTRVFSVCLCPTGSK